MFDKPLSYYLDQYAQGKATPEEKDILARILNDPAYEQELYEVLKDHWAFWEQCAIDFPETIERVQRAVADQIIPREVNIDPVSRRIPFLKTAWFRYAAAVVLTIGAGIGAYFWTTNSLSKKRTSSAVASAEADIAPGGNKALLTLSDGTTITLDSAANGTLAQQGNAQVVKLANGQIAYNLNGVAEGGIMMNTMRTPRGGQYQLTLPDGTKVWLNAASSITYPANFVGNDRKVSITGEAYMEVVKNPKHSFIVTANGAEIQVLGTSFNVNAYADENAVKTTLISGSVKVMRSASSKLKKPSEEKAIILQPGQQAQSGLTGTGISIIDNADIDQAIAWKNGLFNFNGTNLQSVLHQLERWYDIQISYEGTLPDIEFQGKLDRGVPLSDVVKYFKRIDIKCRIEGRKLIMQ